VLSTDQVLALADVVPHRYRVLIIVGAGTGLRPGELWGLTVDRVEFLRSQLHVNQQLVWVRGEGVRLTPKLKTKTSYRTLPLPEAVKNALAQHLAEFAPHPDLGLIFTNQWGGPIQQYPFSQLWETAKRKAGLPAWATPHDLRHYYASLLIASEASIKVVQARLGHSSAKVTLDTYGHLFHDEEDRTRRAVDDAFSGRAIGSTEDSVRTEEATD
jgi:integrase